MYIVATSMMMLSDMRVVFDCDIMYLLNGNIVKGNFETYWNVLFNSAIMVNAIEFGTKSFF